MESTRIRFILDRAINEADQNRREFLKRSGAGLVASLLQGGIPSQIVTRAVAGKPLTALLNLGIGWDMGRGEHADLAQMSAKLNLIYNFLMNKGINVYGLSGEDAGVNGVGYDYVLQLDTDTLSKLSGLIKHQRQELADVDDTDYDEDIYSILLPGNNHLDLSVSDRPMSDYASGNHLKPITDPMLDFWNQYARLDGENAARNLGWVQRLLGQFGDKLEKPLVPLGDGDLQEIALDQLEKYAEDGFGDEDLEEPDDELNQPDARQINKRENAALRSDEDEDEYQKNQWATDGGFNESIQLLYRRISDQSITLKEALEWVQELSWPAEYQQRLAIQYIQRSIIE